LISSGVLKLDAPPQHGMTNCRSADDFFNTIGHKRTSRRASDSSILHSQRSRRRVTSRSQIGLGAAYARLSTNSNWKECRKCSRNATSFAPSHLLQSPP
jgi:hypothetical protein